MKNRTLTWHYFFIILAVLLSITGCIQTPPVPSATTVAQPPPQATPTRGAALATPTAVTLNPTPTQATVQTPTVATAPATPTTAATIPTTAATTPTPSAAAGYNSPSGFSLIPPTGWEVNEQKFNIVWFKPNTNRRTSIQVVKAEQVTGDIETFLRDSLEIGQRRGDIRDLRMQSSPILLGGVEAVRLEATFTRASDNVKIIQIDIGAKRDSTLYTARLGTPEDQLQADILSYEELLRSFAFGPPITTNMLAFVREGAVWLYRTDSLRLWQVTAGQPSARLVGWSNTGEQLYYVREPGNELVVMNADGGDERVLLRAAELPNIAPDANITHVAWSPLGDRLLLIVRTVQPTLLYTVNVDGTEPARIGLAFEAVWAPQGKQVAYRNSRSDVGPVNLFVANQDGTNIRNLTEAQQAFVTGLDWGNNGIAFLNLAIPNSDIGRNALEMINPDGSNRRVVVQLPSEKRNIALAWVGNSAISFLADTPDNITGTLQVVNLAAPTPSAQTVITGVSQPNWTVDGSRVAFVRQVNGTQVFMANALDGSALRQLTYQESNTAPAWSPQVSGLITQSPQPVLTPTPAQIAITISEPQPGATVRSPVRVAGTAMVFEATVSIRVRDASGNIIGKGFATATDGAPARGIYSADIDFTPPATTQQGMIEVYEESARDGTERNLISVRVTLQGR